MSGWPFSPPKPPTPPAPTTRTIQVIVRDASNQDINGAHVSLMVGRTANDEPVWDEEVTIAGLATLTISASLADTQLDLHAEGYVDVDQHLVVTGVSQVWVGGGVPSPETLCLPPMRAVPVAPAVLPHDPRKVRCNFASLWDPVLSRWIFQCMYPSMDTSTRKRWREIAIAAGDTHFQIGNPTTPFEDYHIPAYTDWLSEDMAHWIDCARELVDAGFTLIAYADSGDRYPGAGYHSVFFNSIPDDLKVAPDGTPRMIGVPGHEIIPGGYSTKNGNDAVVEIASAGVRLIAMHTGDDRLSWSSHPVEADDPFHGDEIACYHGLAGNLLTHHFCQLRTSQPDDPLVDTVESSVVSTAHGISSRVDGSKWVDPNGNPCPDWGIPWIDPVLWETDEELLFKGERTRAQILAVTRACLRNGFTGYGCGTPPAQPDAT